MRTGRTSSIARAAIAAATALIATALVVPGPSYATPSIDEVEERVSRLYHEAEIASERYNDVKAEMTATKGRLEALRSDVERQRRQVEQLRDRLGVMVAAQAQASPFGASSQMFASDDPTTFVDSLAATQAYNVEQLGLLDSFEAESDELRIRSQQLDAQLESIAAAERRLADYKAEIDDKADEAQALLDELKAEQRERVEVVTHEDTTSRSTDVRVPTTVPASGRAQVAIDFALGQVGDYYTYGGTGPDGWDCSGLTMGSWGAAGVALPHSSSSQAAMGTPVSLSSIAPGDLVFYYSPISHVGIYIGNGQLVHAANPSTGVQVTSVTSMPITSIRRVG